MSGTRGIYRVQARLAGDMERWPDAQCQWLPAVPITDRDALLDALSDGLAFPAHFGHNWDAAWDCMTDLVWNDDKPRIILCPLIGGLGDGEGGGSAPPPMAAFLEVMGDACEHWASRGRSLVVLLVHSDERLPAWLSAIEVFPGHRGAG